MTDVPFLAINTDNLQWDDNVTLFQLPTGAHKIHPNLKIKVLMRDDKQGQVAALVKFPPGYYAARRWRDNKAHWTSGVIARSL